MWRLYRPEGERVSKPMGVFPQQVCFCRQVFRSEKAEVPSTGGYHSSKGTIAGRFSPSGSRRSWNRVGFVARQVS